MLELLHQALELQAALIRCCRSAGWQPQFLGQPGAPGIGLGQALQEINLCREHGASQLSAELIQYCKAMGWTSPWLEDNSARLFIHTHRQQAIAIWQHLLTNQEPDVAAAASQALDNLQEHSSEADLQAATTAAREQGLATPWRKLLRRRLLEPDGMTSPVLASRSHPPTPEASRHLGLRASAASIV